MIQSVAAETVLGDPAKWPAPSEWSPRWSSKWCNPVRGSWSVPWRSPASLRPLSDHPALFRRGIVSGCCGIRVDGLGRERRAARCRVCSLHSAVLRHVWQQGA